MQVTLYKLIFKVFLNNLIEWTKMGHWPMHLYIHALYIYIYLEVKPIFFQILIFI